VLAATRPTAVNLCWALERMQSLVRANRDQPTVNLKIALEYEALAIAEDDLRLNRNLGRHGEALFADGARILTHCNAGALATGGYGTALGVIRAAVAAGKKLSVYADETRPWLQGARLTAWELQRDGIPVTLICDNMAGWLMAQGKIDAVIVGADRIAANGDTANKIGTYSVAVLAKEHDIPFYVAAPTSTIDLTLADGSLIPIEERNAREVTHLGEQRLAPEGVAVYNPAFDVTPARLISAIITEYGVARADYRPRLAELVAKGR
jgi:methylthioribose-1-phosphate isomerase